MGEMMHFPDTVEEFMEVFKVVDSDHVYSNGTEFVPIFRMQQWFDHLKAQPKTEGDKIRAMSDDELAEFLKNVHRNGNGGNSPMSGMLTASDCWTDWLKQEVE